MISAQVAPLLAVCGRTEAINVREGGRAWLPMVLAAELTQAPPFQSLESVACTLSPSLPVDSWLRSCDVRYFSHCAPLARQLRLDRTRFPLMQEWFTGPRPAPWIFFLIFPPTFRACPLFQARTAGELQLPWSYLPWRGGRQADGKAGMGDADPEMD